MTNSRKIRNDSPLLNSALELVWPTRCAGCEKPGTLLCDTCRASLLSIAASEACARCGAPFGKHLCTECYGSEGRETFSFSQAVSCVEMDERAGRVVVLYKDHNEHRLATLLAEALSKALPATWLPWAEALTWIPASKKALRRRGFDHMELVAQELAHITGLPALKLLEKLPSKDQRTLGRAERKKNLESSLALAKDVEQPPSRVILLDDVFTTGATLDAAATKLKEGGTKEVRAATYARVW